MFLQKFIATNIKYKISSIS